MGMSHLKIQETMLGN